MNRIETREPASATDTVVLNLFGQATSTPQYAIHDEDQLEWLHALLSEWASLPEWLASPLKHQPMLFVGCEIPDWLGRFLVRMSSTSRLSMERVQQFFIVGNSISREPTLSTFFTTYCRKTLVRQLDMEPTTFVSELRERWEKMTARHAVPTTGSRRSRGSALRVVSLRTPRPSLSAICVRTPTPPGGCVTRSPASAGTCGSTSAGYARAMSGRRKFSAVLVELFNFSFRSSPRTRRVRTRATSSENGGLR